MALPKVLMVLFISPNILLMSDFDDPLLDEPLLFDDLSDLVDLSSSSAGVSFTVHAALGCPFLPQRKHSLSL